MKKIKKKNIASACALFAAGLLMFTGCVTDDVRPLDGEVVYIPVNDLADTGPFVAHKVMLTVKYADKQKITEMLVSDIGTQIQEKLRSRGHHVPALGGALVDVSVSMQELRPFGSSFEYRAYVATADVQVSAQGKAIRNRFTVDGSKLCAKKYCVTESAALLPVQSELLKNIDTWLACVLKSKPDATR